MTITRREFLRAGAASAAVAVAVPLLAGCGSSGNAKTSTAKGGKGALPKSASIEVAWWGGSTDDQVTEGVIKAFEKAHKGWKVTPSFADFSDYFNSMNVKAAAGSLPDVVQLGGSYVPQYAGENQLLDLSPYVKDGTIDTAGFDQGQLLQGSDDNKLYALTDGGNMPAMVFNATLIEKAGMQPPAEGITWADFATYCAKLKDHLPKGVYPLDDNSGTGGPGLLVWVRQTHQNPYTAKGLLNYSVKDVEAWFQYWETMRKAGLVVPGTMEAEAIENGTNNGAPIVLGKAVFNLIWSNYNSQYSALMKDKLGIMRYPTGGQGGKLVGDFLQASQFLSVSSKSKSPLVAATFVDYFMNNPDAIKILGVDRGVPAAVRNQKILLDSGKLDFYDHQQVAFLSQYGPMTRTLAQAPANSGPLTNYLEDAAQAVALGTSSVSSAAQQYIANAEKALEGTGT